jgi:hypothetical protein
MMLIGRSVRRVRRVRVVSCAVVAMVALVMEITPRREVGIATGNGWFVALGNGSALAGFESPPVAAPPPTAGWPTQPPSGPAGVYFKRRYESQWALAWRPFRASSAPGEGFLVAPLWPAGLAALMLACWAHGWLRASRYSAARRCAKCDYPVEQLLTAAHAAPCCPECGTPVESSRAGLLQVGPGSLRAGEVGSPAS